VRQDPVTAADMRILATMLTAGADPGRLTRWFTENCERDVSHDQVALAVGELATRGVRQRLAPSFG